VNHEQFLRLLELTRDDGGRLVLPAGDPAAARIYGGQLLAQLIVAATPPGPGKSVKSVHAAFPREARTDSPVHLDLEAIHEGRSTGLRRATVWQDRTGGPVIAATASILLDEADDGFDYQQDRPPDGMPEQAATASFAVVPGEARLASGTGLHDDRAQPAELSFWIRCPGIDGDVSSRALVAYVSDWPLIGTLLKAVPGVSERDAHVTLQTAVLTHSIWFHQPVSASGWLRLEVRGRRLAGGRGYGSGEVYSEAGALVASFAQESVIRRSRGAAHQEPLTVKGRSQ
jgi:acyl-CoA thioesterase II